MKLTFADDTSIEFNNDGSEFDYDAKPDGMAGRIMLTFWRVCRESNVPSDHKAWLDFVERVIMPSKIKHTITGHIKSAL